MAAAAAVLLAACTSTSLTDSWADPSARSAPPFRKVLAAVLSQDPLLRRSAEDALVANIKRTTAVPSYTLIPESEMGDLEAVKARLRQAGVDGVVVMRLAGIDKETTWVPGTYSSFGGYWGMAAPMVYDPGYLRTDTIVRVETRVYSVKDEKLLYSARSKTFNPTDAKSTVGEIVESIADDLRRRGLLP